MGNRVVIVLFKDHTWKELYLTKDADLLTCIKNEISHFETTILKVIEVGKEYYIRNEPILVEVK